MIDETADRGEASLPRADEGIRPYVIVATLVFVGEGLAPPAG